MHGLLSEQKWRPKWPIFQVTAVYPRTQFLGSEQNLSIILSLPTGTCTVGIGAFHLLFWHQMKFSVRAHPTRMGGACTFRPLLALCFCDFLSKRQLRTQSAGWTLSCSGVRARARACARAAASEPDLGPIWPISELQRWPAPGARGALLEGARGLPNARGTSHNLWRSLPPGPPRHQSQLGCSLPPEPPRHQSQLGCSCTPEPPRHQSRLSIATQRIQ